MKKLTVILSWSLFLTACSKGFLDLAPISNASVNGFYRNASDIEVAVNSAYGMLHTPGLYRDACWQVGEVRSDNSWNWDGGGNFPEAEIDQFKESSSNSIVNSMWLDHYHGIFLCNIVLDRIAAVPMDEALRNRFIGEMKFLRALMYFNLVRTFGKVPLVTKETVNIDDAYKQGRTSEDSVYGQIIADLTTAAAYLPAVYEGQDIGRATSGAAKTLLGKVYLTRRDFNAAAGILGNVIASGRYSLLPQYGNLWNPANANNAESIFEVQFKKGGTGTGSPYTNFFAPRNSGLAVCIVGFAYGRNLPTGGMVDAYETNDSRKAASIAEVYRLNGQVIEDPYTVKYSDIPFADRDADNNFVILRYADVLLMYAEALNEVHGGPNEESYAMLNAVRTRAGLMPLSGQNRDAFALSVEHERRVELAFEGHRWYDLVRTGRALDVMNAHFAGTMKIEPYQLLLPVPQSQVNINPSLIFQNEGY